jgi:hypothetical protein
MFGIDWPSIAADLVAVAAVLVRLFAAVVALEAERLQWVVEEGRPIALMGLDVVGDGGRHHEAIG